MRRDAMRRVAGDAVRSLRSVPGGGRSFSELVRGVVAQGNEVMRRGGRSKWCTTLAAERFHHFGTFSGLFVP